MDKTLKCAYCGRLLVNVAITRRYCSNACKQAAWRERKKRKEQKAVTEK